MRKSTPDFEIHVDSSCLTDGMSTETHNDNVMSPERVSSNQTVVHHDSWQEEEKAEEKPTIDGPVNDEAPAGHEDENAKDEVHDEEHDEEQAARERQIDRIEAQIQAAARAVVASIEQENYGGNGDSELSMRTDESYEPEGTELTYDGTELTYNGTEATYESGHDQHSEPEGGDSSSHHDGDIDDDVFSHSDQSKRSSLNSCHDILSSDENQKLLTSPVVGEEAASSNENEPISRIPSATSYMQAPADSAPRTPCKVLSRPPFRTPSSVRAMQMSSPTPSIFSSPRSTKRHLPNVSRIGTPNSLTSPSKRTPTRFKAKKELPLVLLHVTVLPLQWPYSHLMSSPDIPESLHNVKDSWRLLQEKLGDTVLERGILLPHPQDSYEVLEERLLEALELPVHPRALILKCGHYMGPSETPSSDEEAGDYWGREQGQERKWCDICGRDVKIEEVGDVAKGERRFRVKIYASNGLMRAGAWAAAWREMERVDVEIEPFVDGLLGLELEHLATITSHDVPAEEEQEHDDGFVDEDTVEHVHEHETHDETPTQQEEEDLRRKILDEERMREIYGHDALEVPRPKPERRSSSRVRVHDDSLPDLLLAAFKVAMRDNKNVAIVVLSLFILILALRPSTVVHHPSSAVVMESPSVAQITTTVFKEATVTETIPVVTSIIASVEAAKVVESPVPGVQTPATKVDPCQDRTQPIVEAPPPSREPVPELDFPSIEVPLPSPKPEQNFVPPSPDPPSPPVEAAPQEPIDVVENVQKSQEIESGWEEK
jgi:hypothetical protein